MINTEQEPHDAHVILAHKIFRDCGFTLAAMQYKKPAAALEGLKKFNRVPEGYTVPFAWGFFPNAYMRDNWEAYYG